MRTIKFRGKRLDNGEWGYGDLIENQGRFFIYHATSESTIEDNENGRIVVVAVEVDSSTVGQFAELKDEKGREIYEGDIVRDEYEGVAKVCFDSYSWQLIYGIGDDGNQVQSFEELDGLRIAIIDNIHDNPELNKTE